MGKPVKKTSSEKSHDFLASIGHQTWSLWLVLLIVTVIYAPSLQNGFVNLDDPQYVLENSAVQAFNVENIKKIFSSQFVGNYQPVTMLSYMIDHALFGLDPFGWHLTSLLLYLGIVALVFLIIEKLVGIRSIAFWSAIIYGLHPLHVESVSWVSERKDLLYAIFFLGGLYMYATIILSSKQNSSPFRPSPFSSSKGVICLLLFTLSLLSKAQAVVFPIALLAVDLIYRRRLNLKIILEKWPLLIPALGFGILAISVQGEAGALQTYQYFPFYERILFSCYALMTYLHKMILPIDLSCFYPYPETDDKINSIWVYLSPVVLAMIFMTVYKFFRKDIVVIAGLIFFLIMIAPVLQLLPVGDALYADRYTFLPSFGFFLALIWLFFKKTAASRLNILVALLCVFYGYQTYAQSKTWKDSLTLYTASIDNGYKAAIIYNNRGKALSDSGDYAAAVKDFESLVALKPRYPNAWRNKGLVHQRLEEHDKAIASFTEGLKYYPEDVVLYQNRGAVYIKINQFDKAVEDFSRVIALQPQSGEGYYARSEAFGKSNRLPEALSDINKAIELAPENAQAYNNRGIIFSMQGKHAEAHADFTKSLGLNPDNGSAYTNRSLANRALGNFQEAYNDLLAAKAKGVMVDEALLEELKKK